MRILILMLLFTTIAEGVETHRYIAYADKFKAKTDEVAFTPSDKVGWEKSLNEFGKTDQAQPSENTQFIVVKNTDVVIHEISFADDVERTLYDKMEADGRLYLFGVSETVNEGGVVRVKKRFSRPIPIDINKSWEAGVSSESQKNLK